MYLSMAKLRKGLMLYHLQVCLGFRRIIKEDLFKNEDENIHLITGNMKGLIDNSRRKNTD